MWALSLGVLGCAFFLRALRTRGPQQGPWIRCWASIRVLFWSLWTALLLITFWAPFEDGTKGWPFLALSVLVGAWVVLDPTLKRGGGGEAKRSLLAVCFLAGSLFLLLWHAYGGAGHQDPLLYATLTGQKALKTHHWKPLTGSAQQGELPSYAVELQLSRETPLQHHEVVGDLLSVRYRRLRFWWPLEWLGLSPVAWVDGVRGEWLDPEADTPSTQLLPLSGVIPERFTERWMAQVRLWWTQVFRGAPGRWWLGEITLESQGLSLVDERGQPREGHFVLVHEPLGATFRVWSPPSP